MPNRAYPIDTYRIGSVRLGRVWVLHCEHICPFCLLLCHMIIRVHTSICAKLCWSLSICDHLCPFVWFIYLFRSSLTKLRSSKKLPLSPAILLNFLNFQHLRRHKKPTLMYWMIHIMLVLMLWSTAGLTCARDTSHRGICRGESRCLQDEADPQHEGTCC